MTLVPFDLKEKGWLSVISECDKAHLTVHWFYGTRYFANQYNKGLCYSIDDVAQQVIREIQNQKNTFSDQDTLYALYATDALITLYKNIQNDKSLSSRFFKCLWEWLGWLPTEEQQITALEAVAQEIKTLSYAVFAGKYTDSSQAKLTQDQAGRWVHPDLEGTYEENPQSVCMSLEGFKKYVEVQRKLLPTES